MNQKHIEELTQLLKNIKDGVAIAPWEPQASDGPLADLVTAANDLAKHVQKERQSHQDELNQTRDVKHIIESLGIGIWKWDLSTNELEWDANMYKLYGCDPSDFSGAYEAWETSLSPETRTKAVEEIITAVNGGPDFDTTFAVVHKNTGKIQDIRTRAFLIRDESGQAVKMWGINLDRSSEARLEDAVKNSNVFLEQAEELAKIGGWELDLNSGNCRVSAQWKLLQDIDVSENVTQIVRQNNFPKEVWPKVEVAFQRAKEQGIEFELEVPFHTNQGRDIWLRMEGVRTAPKESSTILRGTFQDITRRKLNETNLEIYKAVLDNATDFVGISDTNLEHIYLNPFGQRMLGMPSERAVESVKIEDYYPEDIRQSMVGEIIEGMTTIGFWSGETEFQNISTKERIPVSDTHFAVTDPSTNHPIAYATISRDLRDQYRIRKQAEMTAAELEEERMKSVHSAKLASLGEMAAGIAHEINNPLAIIHGTARALERFRQSPIHHAERVAHIQSASERIAKIVRSLSRYSRSDTNKEVKPYDLARIIRESITLTAAKARRHSTSIEFGNSSDICILCDDIEIEQVIINLINNAVDAVKAQDERWVTIELMEENKQAVLQISNGGPKISPDIADKLFQPFFTTKPVGQGTGLGLSISKGILDSHGATIQLREDKPHTCFEIRIPISTEPPSDDYHCIS